MKKRRYSLATPREFVKAWQTSSFVREVARKVGSTKGACSRRAARYREMGVPLKFMAPIIPAEPTDWDELAEYARELAPEGHAVDAGDDQEAMETPNQAHDGSGSDPVPDLTGQGATGGSDAGAGDVQA